MSRRLAMVLALLWTGIVSTANAAELQRLSYNRTDLVTDLGVGLWAWPVPTDADDDGDSDLIVVCPGKPSNGVFLFENKQAGGLVMEKGRKLSPGLTNTQPSYRDGKLIALVPTSLAPVTLRRFDEFATSGITSFTEIRTQATIDPGKGNTRARQFKLVDFDGDGDDDLVAGIGYWGDYGWDNAFNEQGEWTNGPLHGFIYLILNEGRDSDPVYAKAVQLEAAGKPIDVFGMPSPNFADFDGDGDLDLLCGEFVDSLTYFENTGSRTQPAYAAGRPLTLDGQPLRMELCMIVPVAYDWDNDGDMDLVVGEEDGRVAYLEHTGKVQDGLPVFTKPVFFKQKADNLKVGALATPYGVDWDADGDEDLIVGDTAGYLNFVENLGGNPPKWNPPQRLQADGKLIRIQAGPNGSIQGPCEAKWGYTVPAVADWNHDGLLDIVINSIWGEILWYEGTGTPTQPALKAAQPITVAWNGSAPKPAWNWWNPKGQQLVTQWRTSPIVIDLNQDGLNDLVMLDHEGYLAFFERQRTDSGLTLYPGRRVFEDESGQPLRLNDGIAGKSGRRKLVMTDWDRDGDLDIIINGSKNADFFENVTPSDVSDQTYRFASRGAVSETVLGGHTTCPTTVDWNRDGVRDLVIGAEDGFFYYLQNPIQDQPAVLTNEFIYEEAPFPECHASTIEQTKDGLIAAWFGGKHEKNPDVEIWISKHDGQKWSAPEMVADGVQSPELRHPCWNPVLFQPKQGPLMLFYKVGPDPQTWWGMLITSQDGGKTWSKPQRLPDGILGPIKNKPVQLADGTILSGSSTEHDGWRVHLEMSSDLGKTWKLIGPINDGKEFGAIQPAILLHPGGKLQLLCRSQQRVVTQSWSEDGGKTWSAMTATNLDNPNSGIDAVTLADGRHLLVYNDTPRGRSPLNVAISTDGVHWRPAVTLETEPGEYSYPAVIQTSDGKVHITYTWKRRKIKHVVLDLSKLFRT